MRKVVLGLAVSLDGFIEGPNGEYDWCVPDPEYDFGAFFGRIDTIFVGRKTYEMSAGMEGGAEGFPTYKEYVFSTTLEKVTDGKTLVNVDIKAHVDQIKKEKGKDIWLFGGAGLTESMIKLELVDELSLGIYPVLLGGGKPLFRNIERHVKLRMLNSRSYPSGMVSLDYAFEK